jgi:hypothetical protein
MRFRPCAEPYDERRCAISWELEDTGVLKLIRVSSLQSWPSSKAIGEAMMFAIDSSVAIVDALLLPLNGLP